MESLAATLTAVTVIVLATLSAVDTSGCDRDTGPGGVSMCLQFKGYDGPQWGACLTTIYVDRISRGKHQCIENSSTYCWYQCMIETHDEADGNVTADCACDAFSSTETNTTLNHTCYSPPGDVCSWYRDCLERKFPCRESSDNYAIAYAENMCNLYGQQKDELSSQGAYWLDVVRKCLQVVLVPLLRPFESGHVTCDTVRKHALKSHASCYTDPYLQAPSICDLSASDLWTVFWGVRGRFTSYFVESLYGLIQVGT
ncbi:hypothetical protein BaRGS_00012323 [Batillaria attramentaria]|uniref:Uncharacterized protein n=1 Tax=Batillaria attramentaria TaxID=370345 RepID=A0ABD0LAU1_9CAEN